MILQYQCNECLIKVYIRCLRSPFSSSSHIGGHIAQVLDDFRDDLDDMVDLLHGVVLAYRQAQGAVGDLMRQAEREQNMARVEGAGGAGAAGGSADAVGVEHEQQGLALDAPQSTC